MAKLLVLLLVLISLAFTFAQDNQQGAGRVGVTILETNVKQGECERPAGLNDHVSLLYTGKFADGTIFDSSTTPFNFTIGERKVIPGVEISAMGICAGEKRTVRIPYQLAYGEEGIEGQIPPKSDLIFDFEVVEIVFGPSAPFYTYLIPSFATIGSFSMVIVFIGIVRYIIKRYPDEVNAKKPAAGKPKKTKAAKQN